MKAIGQLLKPGIVILVLLCALLGYGLGYTVESRFSMQNLVFLVLGILLLSGGSLGLNQAQEWTLDLLMPRTQRRPIPSGLLTPKQGYLIGFAFAIIGTIILYQIRPMTAWLGILTVVLYNVFYTAYWKKKWVFAAVPGAIPGALPVVIGFSAINPDIFSSACIYGFLVMFLWQMPHFWSLAIRFRSDYELGGIPVLPVKLGVDRTLFHIGLYTFVYVALAMASPLFVDARYVYLFLVIPFGLKVMWEFFRFFHAQSLQLKQTRWIHFFLWVNFSLLAFLIAPVIDKFSQLLEFL